MFVGNITNRVQKHELKGDFEKYGRVQEVFIGNGFGFITFDDGRSASRAVDVSFFLQLRFNKYVNVVIPGDARPALCRGKAEGRDFL